MIGTGAPAPSGEMRCLAIGCERRIPRPAALPLAVTTAVQNQTVASGVNSVGPVNTLALRNGSSATTTINLSNSNTVTNSTPIATIVGR